VSEGNKQIERTIQQASDAAKDSQSKVENSQKKVDELDNFADELSTIVGHFKISA